jgi:RND family efflux transporter MFP subunit
MSLDHPIPSASSEPTDELKNTAVKASDPVLASVSTEPIRTEETAAKRPPQRKTWLWVILVLLIGGGGFVGWRLLGNRKAPPPPQMPPLPVKVQSIESSQVQSTSEFVSTLEALQRVSLEPEIAGRVERVFVSSGERVRKGMPILSLSLDQTQANVISAIAVVNANRAALATAEAQLQSKQADRATSASNLKLQQAQFKRIQYLVNEGVQAKQQLDIYQNSLETAITALASADKQVSASLASVNQAAANVKQAQAQVASNQVNLKQKQVLAPIDGVVGDFSIKAGDYVSIAQTLTTLTKNDVLDMRISVPANNVAQLRYGLPVELLNAKTGEQLTRGSIYFISPQVDSSQAILVKARFSNTNGKLRDGQYVRARIIWNQKSGLVIPVQAVNRVGGQSFVYLVAEDRSKGKPQFVVHQKPVKLGDVQNDHYPILEGIKEGDRVATSNILKLRDGAPIQPEP